MQFFAQVMGEIAGPLSFDQLKKLATHGTIDSGTRIRRGDGDWQSAGSIDGLLPAPEATLPPVADPSRRLNRTKSTATFPVVGTEEFRRPGLQIRSTLSVVRSYRVYGVDLLAEIFGVALSDLFGGRSNYLESSFRRLEDETLEDIKTQAIRHGATALVKLNLQSGVIERGKNIMLYSLAQATPVILERTPSDHQNV